MADRFDTCPDQSGNSAAGATSNGPDAHDITVDVAAGTHELRVEWEVDGEVLATATRTVVHRTSGTDRDRDGHSNGKERAHGTDPKGPRSYPGRKRSTTGG